MLVDQAPTINLWLWLYYTDVFILLLKHYSYELRKLFTKVILFTTFDMNPSYIDFKKIVQQSIIIAKIVNVIFSGSRITNYYPRFLFLKVVQVVSTYVGHP